jgi:hypothetical protein
MKAKIQDKIFLIIDTCINMKATICEEIQPNQISNINAQLTNGNETNAQESDRADYCVRIKNSNL